MTPRPTTDSSRGQILVIFVLALVAVIAMAGLLLDGGAAFAQQRLAQNGSDAAATAGTVVIAEKLGGATRTGDQVLAAVTASAAANGLANWTAEYTDDFGNAIGVTVAAGAIPAAARGVRVGGDRSADATFSRVIGVDQMKASAEATVVAGALSGECVATENGCALLPVTFPVKVSTCDSQGNATDSGNWIGAPPPGSPSDGYWPTVGIEALPSATNPTGDTSSMAILPLCRGSADSTGAFGFLDLVPGMNLAQEITGPLNDTIDLPDWFQTQTGNPNSVEDELLLWHRKPVFIPLHNQACRSDPGNTDVCSDPGVHGNNTWYYVHTLAVFYIEHVHVQGSNKNQCASAPGSPTVPITNGAGFLGCIKGWFVNYVTAGPIVPGGTIIPGQTAIGIQLIH